MTRPDEFETPFQEHPVRTARPRAAGRPGPRKPAEKKPPKAAATNPRSTARQSADTAADMLKPLQEAVKNILAIDPALRPRSSDGLPGGLIEFPKTEKREFIIVGDLHGQVRNLRAILKDAKDRRETESEQGGAAVPR